VRGASLFIMSHEVDMQNPICWLSRTPSPGGFAIPPGRDEVNPIRQVLQPFEMRVEQRASRPDAGASGDAERYAHVQARCCGCLCGALAVCTHFNRRCFDSLCCRFSVSSNSIFQALLATTCCGSYVRVARHKLSSR
jgi:hypothetical protein